MPVEPDLWWANFEIDVQVGRRIRHRRWLLGMTQIALGRAVGVRFQQIQKYETGANRVPVSRLWEIAAAQQIGVGYYFEGLEVSLNVGSENSLIDVGELLKSKETIDFVSMCRRLPNGQRQKLLALAKSISAA